MFRYVALIWTAADPAGQESAARLVRRLVGLSSGWRAVVETPGLLVLCTGHLQGPSTAYPLSHQAGVVLGTVFHRANSPDATHAPHFTERETQEILASRGRVLMDSCWGRYVAFVRDSAHDTVWVVKDPVGRLPCLVAQCEGVFLVFSYLPDCIAAGVVPQRINGRYVAARVALGTAPPEDTGIEDVTEVCGGQCVTFHAGALHRQLYWDPYSLVTRESFEDPEHAAHTLRATTQTCVHAWAGQHKTLLLRLSGGLDSSIVLACLADAPSRPRVVCLTYHREGGPSDERPWARLAAQRAGCEHFEHARTPRFEFQALSRMHPLASPPLTSAFLETDRVERHLTEHTGATAICSGDGGDSLFGSTAAAFAVADYVKRHGLRPALLPLASDVALLRNQTVWRVLSGTLRPRREDRDDARRLREARQLVCPDLREALLATRGAFGHPWFRAGRHAPGVREILSLLTQPELFYPPLARPDGDSVETISPLLSQPLVELCLRIPSYTHFHEGRDRGLARRAFADAVPTPILARTWKDRVPGFPEEILRVNLPHIREMLLEGILVRERYLDRAALETALTGAALEATASVGEILDHMLVEAWLRSWSERGVAPASR